AATFTVRLMLPILSRQVREWTLITMTFGIALVAYIAFPLVRTVPLLASIAFLLGLGLGATQPSILALVYSTAPAARAGEAVGVRTVVLNASHTVLPLVFGGLGTAWLALRTTVRTPTASPARPAGAVEYTSAMIVGCVAPRP